jgi:23S rRNA pseudouridine1911/1915/1917 synthase
MVASAEPRGREEKGHSIQLAVPAWVGAERLGRALARMFPALSRSYLKKLAKEGHCWVNGQPCGPETVVDSGDLICLRLPAAPTAPCHPEPGPLDVRYEDAHLLVVVKPPGMVSHPATGHHTGTLLNRIVHHLWEEIQRGWSRPHLVGRLDRWAAGLVLVAKTPAARRGLQHALEQRRVGRRYLALVWGAVCPVCGSFASPLPTVESYRQPQGPRKHRPARTEYRRRRLLRLPPRVVAPGAPAAVSVVEVRLHTGRTHQIRMHFAHAGHPVLGDDLYGCRTWQQPADPQFARLLAGVGGYALHCWELSFAHPVSGEAMRVRAAPLPGFCALLQWLVRQDQQVRAQGESAAQD